MLRSHLPLNGLRAFEASARHLSFTRAAIELCVTQAAVSHQVKSLEAQLNVTLFKRLPRGLMLTSEGETLLPVLRESFDRIAQTLSQFEGGHYREVLTVGAVGTFAVGWLLPRLPDFHMRYPFIDLRLSTHNNRVDVAADDKTFDSGRQEAADRGLLEVCVQVRICDSHVEAGPVEDLLHPLEEVDEPRVPEVVDHDADRARPIPCECRRRPARQIAKLLDGGANGCALLVAHPGRVLQHK